MYKLLLVEDDPTLNANIKDFLSANQFAVDVAFDGAAALKYLKSKEYNIAILDINVPFVNGLELCKKIREQYPNCSILMLTALGSLDDKIEGFNSGADDYMIKPFFLKELLARVQALVRRGYQSAQNQISTIIKASDIVIDTNQKKVTRQNKTLELTPREYEILLLLIEHKNQVVLKKKIIEKIWGNNFDSNTNTLEVYMNFLRNKVDKPFGKESIKTKVGYGYYFEE